MARLIRVTSLPASRRRAGFAFTREPLTLGRESFADGVGGLIQLAALVGDPGLAVERSDEDTPDVFIPITEEERAAVLDIARAAELEADSEDAAQAFEQILEGLVGTADDASTEDDEHGRRLEAKRLADDAEEKRLADEAEAKRLADEAANPPAPPAPAPETEPKKGDAAPAKAKAKADAKPQGSSGRQSKPATPAAKD